MGEVYCEEVIRVLESMKDSGLKPNLVTYNAVIDAYGKGEWSLRGRGGLWEAAQNLCSEMVDGGIDQDIYTYNTLLDAICKGGQMDLAYQMMSEMPSKNILANVVTFSTIIDGYVIC
ncbi:hypothetical protein ACFX2J_025539 [Malus domestica]|uniref:Pentacotripeptide-repeat region of PRORP domain-containing protein n=1 Tax=Malus domestica TaxID=3750 RepID=A0A498HDP2_MALDO|nr:hypothetical protein DVH24_030727 [Malus domestica]